MSIVDNMHDLSYGYDSNLENLSVGGKDNLMAVTDVEEFCRKIEKDARRYKRFLGNDSQVMLI